MNVIETHKKSIFSGQVNKLCANIQMSVLVRLFKTYCCTFYGSQMWQVNSQYINSVCTSWNKGVRRILNLPHDAHTWLLGPLLKQNHIKKQFFVGTLCFLFCMLKSHNGIVEVCTLNALSNANSPMGSNLSFLRSKYEINFQSHSLAHCIKVVTKVKQLDSQSNCLIEQLRILLRSRCNEYVINGFTHDEITEFIHEIACH